MQDARKLAFIAHMTKQGLDHVARTPNLVAPNGEMSHDKKLRFIQTMAKTGLQHFDSGGAVSPGALQGPTVTAGNSAPTQSGLDQGLGNTLGVSNQFTASGASIQSGTNVDQLNAAYSGVQGGITAQQNLATALAPGTFQAAENQGSLANQEIAEAGGAGPNPAQAQYAQNVNSIAQQEAGAIASTKGISPALAARMSSQQGSAAAQNAAGEGATLAAQQQIAAQQNLQNLSANQVAQGSTAVQGVNNAQQNEQNILQGANTSANNATVAMQSNINNTNASVAEGNQKESGSLLNGIFSGGGSLANAFGARGGRVGDMPRGNMRPMPRPKMASGGVVGLGTAAPQSYVGQWITSTPSSASVPFLGGPGGSPGGNQQNPAQAAQQGAKSANSLKGMFKSKQTSSGDAVTDQNISSSANQAANDAGNSIDTGGTQSLQGVSGAGDQVAANIGTPDLSNLGSDADTAAGTASAVDDSLSAFARGGKILPRRMADGGGLSEFASLIPLIAALNKGGNVKGKTLAARGGNVVPHNVKQKAVVRGDSLKNDKIPTLLSQGEVVLDRDTLNDPGPVGQMARALAIHIAKRNKTA